MLSTSLCGTILLFSELRQVKTIRVEGLHLAQTKICWNEIGCSPIRYTSIKKAAATVIRGSLFYVGKYHAFPLLSGEHQISRRIFRLHDSQIFFPKIMVRQNVTFGKGIKMIGLHTSEILVLLDFTPDVSACSLTHFSSTSLVSIFSTKGVLQTARLCPPPHLCLSPYPICVCLWHCGMMSP